MKQKQSNTIATSKIIQLVALMIAYYFGAFLIRTITNTETYAILGGLAMMGIVYVILRVSSPQKNMDHDERIQQIIKGSWRTAYFAVFSIFALITFYQDFYDTTISFGTLFHLVLIGSGLTFLLYYYFKSRY